MLLRNIFFLLISNILIAQQVDTVAVYGFLAHDTSVASAFVQGYESDGGAWSGIIIHVNSAYQAYSNDAVFYIKSRDEMANHIDSANIYYPLQLYYFMPAGSNTYEQIYSGDLPSIIVTGEGEVNNETGYSIEFHSIDPIYGNASSFSNGYIAGQIAYIQNTLGCSFWEARYRARQTGSQSGVLDNEDGYGLIDIAAAIAYGGEIIADPYEPAPPPELHLGAPPTLAYKIIYDDVLITWDAVDNATDYYVKRNDVAIDTITTSWFRDRSVSRSFTMDTEYKVTAHYNGEVATSDSINVPFRKLITLRWRP